MSVSSTSVLHNILLPHSSLYQGLFGRMFRSLPAWTPTETNEPDIIAGLQNFANTAMSEAPDDPLGDNVNMPAGYTYFGQFVDHDITFDPTSSLQRQNDPNKLHNFRTPRLDLDCLYGEGPSDEPFMYDEHRGGMFLIGQSGEQNEPDLPRNTQGRALIGDMRNDENVIVSQFQLAMLKLHNRIYGQLMFPNGNIPPNFGFDGDKFAQAQRILRWFYQYVVWHDWVKRIVKDAIWKTVLKKVNGQYEYGGQYYNWEYQPFIPIEFSVAAYRFGHSLVRPGYQVNLNTDVDLGFGVEIPIFHPDRVPGQDDLALHDLKGFKNLRKKHTIQWDWYFKMQSSQGPFPQASRKIDPQLSSALFKVTEGPGGLNHLAFLNLMRSWRMGLPSGSAVAQAMGFTPHPVANAHEDVLWHYILKEASSPKGQSGKMLGDVGGTIVAEVFGGLLYGDNSSFVSAAPNWTPNQEPAIMALLPRGKPESAGDNDNDPAKWTWEVADLLRAAGAPINDTDVASTIATGANPVVNS
ncbi:hypothetical protein BFP76_09745 [Amylibacter kogurei]|uniref:Heme peroxidase n=1 Tax=Paramylibacter kogurei TaxID=1889778 RepID=A0A2G5K2N2_9RHOB|nr:peroxidase family protein [Amylibacter kogurei]PIB23282.1 hypothetical protein BFP76_09745 [Amylibacter kogurei]